MTWRGTLQKYSTRAWAYRVGPGWVFGELTQDELEIFWKLPIYGTKQKGSGPVRFPEPGSYNAWLWIDQIEDAELAGCEVEVIEGYGWGKLTPPYKTPATSNQS